MSKRVKTVLIIFRARRGVLLKKREACASQNGFLRILTHLSSKKPIFLYPTGQ